MKLYIYIFILLLLCIFPLDAQQERSESYIRISAPVSLAGALDEIESQTNYSFIYDAQVINLSEKVRKPLSGRSVFEILNLLFKNTEIVYTVMNDQIILNKKEAIIQMQQKLDGKVKGRAYCLRECGGERNEKRYDYGYGWQLCLGASRGGYFGFFLYRLSFTGN